MRTSIYDQLSERRKQEERLERERLEQEAEKVLPVPHKRFISNELSFVRPENLKDKTHHIFTLTDKKVSPFSFVIGRSELESHIDIETIAQQLLVEVKKTLPHIQWIEHMVPVVVAGVDARRMEFRWRQHGALVHQIQWILLHQDEHDRTLLIQVTGSSNNPRGITDGERAICDFIIDSLELRSATDKDEPAELTRPV